jgi:hypothetical protein
MYPKWALLFKIRALMAVAIACLLICAWGFESLAFERECALQESSARHELLIQQPQLNFSALHLPVIHIPMRRFYAEPSLAQTLLNLIRDEHGPMVPTGAPE